MKMICLLLVLFSLESFAGGQVVGNGGDVIVCQRQLTELGNVDPEIGRHLPVVKLLDLVDSQLRMGIEPEFIRGGAWKSKASQIILRMKKLNPSRYNLYSAWLEEFVGATRFVRGVELVDIPDAGTAFLPKGCQIAQVAIQREPDRLNKFRYTINQDLWDLMSENDKAALVLHEIVYREALFYGHTTSELTRYFNSVIHSSQLKKMATSEYNQAVGYAQLRFSEVSGVTRSVERSDCADCWLIKDQMHPDFSPLVQIADMTFALKVSNFTKLQWQLKAAGTDSRAVVFESEVSSTGEALVYKTHQGGLPFHSYRMKFDQDGSELGHEFVLKKTPGTFFPLKFKASNGALELDELVSNICLDIVIDGYTCYSALQFSLFPKGNLRDLTFASKRKTGAPFSSSGYPGFGRLANCSTSKSRVTIGSVSSVLGLMLADYDYGGYGLSRVIFDENELPRMGSVCPQ